MAKNQTESRHVAAAARIGVEVAGPNAKSVDRDSRFPREAVDALKEARLLAAFIPQKLGGLGCGMIELAQMCEALGQHCSSTAMVFAMHQIQVASIVRHAGSSAFFRDYLAEVVEKQKPDRVRHLGSRSGRGDAQQRVRNRATKRSLQAGQGRHHHLLRRAHADELLVDVDRGAQPMPPPTTRY